MISFLHGVILLRDGPTLIINVGGVGYRVLASADCLSDAKIGEEAKIYTYTHVREDILELYGFSKYSDVKLFEQLLGVSGIGPKTAIGVFAIGSGNEIIEAITKGDVDYFIQVPRLGKKNAQRIIIELKTKMGSLSDLDLSGEDREERQEVLVALKSFGFTTQEAMKALQAIKGQGETTEEKIRLALKYLGK